jgi:hypothetical protein
VLQGYTPAVASDTANKMVNSTSKTAVIFVLRTRSRRSST